jgi:predicted DNA-binding protein with PD1-like motif
MQVKQVPGGYAVRLDKGEELVASLAALMRERDVGSGAVTGLGAVTRARLGCYRAVEKDYLEREVAGDLEVASLNGTLSWFDGEPFPHLHVVLTDEEFNATGGHCFAAWASATLEICVRDWGERIDRRRNEELGLHLMELG